MDAVAPEYVAARRVLLDALEALKDHLPSLPSWCGAQAVYHHTGGGGGDTRRRRRLSDVRGGGTQPTSPSTPWCMGGGGVADVR